MAHPLFPDFLGRSDTQLVLIADQRNPQEEGVFGQLLEPAILPITGGGESEVLKTAARPVQQRFHPEFLGESAQLSDRGRAFSQVHEMDFDSPFGEEPQGFARIGALFQAEDLDLHGRGN